MTPIFFCKRKLMHIFISELASLIFYYWFIESVVGCTRVLRAWRGGKKSNYFVDCVSLYITPHWLDRQPIRWCAQGGQIVQASAHL